MLLGALGRWGQGHRVAQALEAVDEAPFHCLTIPLIEVIASQVAVDGPLCQHVIGNDQEEWATATAAFARPRRVASRRYCAAR
jgi:hypothetical protein